MTESFKEGFFGAFRLFTTLVSVLVDTVIVIFKITFGHGIYRVRIESVPEPSSKGP